MLSHLQKAACLAYMKTLSRKISITADQRKAIGLKIRNPSTPRNLATRMRIVLLAADGLTGKSIGQQLKVSQPTVRLWQRRFAAKGLAAFDSIAPEGRRKPKYGKIIQKRLIQSIESERQSGQRPWNCRVLAKRFNMSSATVQRILNRHGIVLHHKRS